MANGLLSALNSSLDSDFSIKNKFLEYKPVPHPDLGTQGQDRTRSIGLHR